MHHPFYDPKKLTDNELQDKLYECMEKQSYSANMGMNQLADNIDLIMYEIRMEQEARLIQAENEYNIRNNIDPNAPITLGEIEEHDTTPKEE